MLNFRVWDLWDEPEAKEPSRSDTKACRKATKRSLRALPVVTASEPATKQDAILRRWIRGKCEACRACPEMIL